MDLPESVHHQVSNIVKAAKLICAELNDFNDTYNSLTSVMNHIQTVSGCEAVGIRLHEHGDYPYYVYNGFAESFIKKESSLCARDENGNRIHEADGKGYLLECMCGNIIRARFNPDFPFFTKKGSFWSNNTTSLLASTTDEDRQTRTRNYCNICGYESVALIPIKVRGDRIGLIQLNDKRKGMYDIDFIEYMEMIGELLGIAVYSDIFFTNPDDRINGIKVLRGILPICSFCKRIRDEQGQWKMVDVYIKDHSEAICSHGICPECLVKNYPG